MLFSASSSGLHNMILHFIYMCDCFSVHSPIWVFLKACVGAGWFVEPMWCRITCWLYNTTMDYTSRIELYFSNIFHSFSIFRNSRCHGFDTVFVRSFVLTAPTATATATATATTTTTLADLDWGFPRPAAVDRYGSPIWYGDFLRIQFNRTDFRYGSAIWYGDIPG